VEVLSVPHFDQLLLVRFGPFSDELPASLGNPTFHYVQIVQFHDRQMLAIFDMDVPRWMLLVYEEHPYDNSVEAANFRHAAVVSSALSSPNVKSGPPRVAAPPSSAAAPQRAVGPSYWLGLIVGENHDRGNALPSWPKCLIARPRL
jgi:hypothetical protein